MNRLLIRNGILIDPAERIFEKRDLYIEDGVVKKVDDILCEIPEGTENIDGSAAG